MNRVESSRAEPRRGRPNRDRGAAPVAIPGTPRCVALLPPNFLSSPEDEKKRHAGRGITRHTSRCGAYLPRYAAVLASPRVSSRSRKLREREKSIIGGEGEVVIASKKRIPGKVYSIPSARRLGETRVSPRRGSMRILFATIWELLHSKTEQIADFQTCIWLSDFKLKAIEALRVSRCIVHRSCVLSIQCSPKMHRLPASALIKDSKRETKRGSDTRTSPHHGHS